MTKPMVKHPHMVKMVAHKLEMWKDASTKNFHWHLKSRNGEIIAASSEGFTQYRACLRNLGGLASMHGITAPDEWRRGRKTRVEVRPGAYMPVWS